MRTSPFTRWISVKNGKETDGLVRYVSTHCPIVTLSIDPKPSDPKSFYRGDSEAWSFLTAGLDVRRRLLQTLLDLMCSRPLPSRGPGPF